MLVSVEKLVKDASVKNYAIGAFNTSNLEMTLGIIRAAIEQKSPVIIQISETTIKYAGLKAITNIVHTLSEDLPADIPVALHLDHGRSFHSVAECIQAGFSSIMIDASEVPYEENVAITKQAVDYAHKKGVWAQGELGQIKTLEDWVVLEDKEETLTDPEQAKDFVDKTGIDTLAVAVGNVWGVYKLRKGVPRLDQERLKSIHKKIPHIPLVLHGGSGMVDEEVKKAIANGVRIINIVTQIKLVFTETLRNILKFDKEIFDPRDVLKPSIEGIKKIVAQKMELFQSKGKAENI